MAEARPALAGFPWQGLWPARALEPRELPVAALRAGLPAWGYSLVAVR